jgi:hypothetical protein
VFSALLEKGIVVQHCDEKERLFCSAVNLQALIVILQTDHGIYHSSVGQGEFGCYLISVLAGTYENDVLLIAQRTLFSGSVSFHFEVLE